MNSLTFADVERATHQLAGHRTPRDRHTIGFVSRAGAIGTQPNAVSMCVRRSSPNWRVWNR
jgi:hypothetical protein